MAAGDRQPRCACFRKATADQRYAVTGYYCRGWSDGHVMIPSIAEYRDFCTTEEFRFCEYYKPKVTPEWPPHIHWSPHSVCNQRSDGA